MTGKAALSILCLSAALAPSSRLLAQAPRLPAAQPVPLAAAPANPPATPSPPATATPDRADPTGLPDDPAALAGREVATNADAQALLDRAGEYLSAAQYREALLLLDHVMQRYPNQRIRQAAGYYRVARLEVERLLAGLPAQAMALYRLTADSQVRAMLGMPVHQCRDKALLHRLFERYYLSGLGDEIGYRLGCLCLDDGQFNRARQIFMKVLDHPDLADPAATSVDRRQLMWRLALCQVAVGPLDQAQQALESLEVTGPLDRRRLELVRHRLEQRRRRLDRAEASTGLLSTVARRMAGLGDSGLPDPDGGWAVLWSRPFSMRIPNQLSRGTYATGQPVNRKTMIQTWRQAGWFPAAGLVFDQNRLWLRSHDGLVCLDLTSGRPLWTYRQPPDAVNGMVRPYSLNNRTGRPMPQQPQEVMAFGDMAIRAISLIDHTIYAIEGTPITQTRAVAVRRDSNGKLVNYGPSQALVALDAQTGKVLWRRWLGLDEEKTAQRIGCRILNAPVAVAGRLLVSFLDQDQWFAALLDPTTGRPVGPPLYLALMPSGTVRWAPVAVLVDGDYAYLADGQGMVLAIDAVAGRTDWVRLIAAPPAPPPTSANLAMRQRLFGRGVDLVDEQSLCQPALFLADGYLVLADSQQQAVYLLDPANGRLLNDGPAGPPADMEPVGFTYALGMHGNGLILGNHEQLVRLDLPRGRLAWRASVKPATGRAVLTDNAIFVPADTRVLRIDPVTGKRLARQDLLVQAGQPLGNLFSDGRHLLSVGLDHVTALVDAHRYMQALTEQFIAGQNQALVERAMLYRQLGQPDQAEADLRLAWRQQADSPSPRLRAELLDLLLERAAASDQPDKALACLEEAAGLADRPEQKQQVALARLQWMLQTRRHDQAMRMCLDLVCADKPAMLHLDRPQGPWQVRSDRWAAARLAELLDQVNDPALVEQADRRSRAAVEAAVQADRTGRLYDLAIALRTLPAGHLAVQGLLQGLEQPGLDPAQRNDRFEQLEALLRELERDDRPAVAAAALAWRADLYEKWHWFNQAAATWHRLARRFGRRRLTWPDPAAPATSAADLAARHLAALAKLTDPHTGHLRPPFRKLWELSTDRYLRIDMPAWRTFDDTYVQSHLLLFDTEQRQLEWRRLDEKAGAVWTVPLPQAGGYQPTRSSWGYALGGGADGHLLIGRWGGQMIGLGVVSGRLRWQRQVQAMASVRIPSEPGLAERLSYPFDVGGGLVVEAVAAEDGLHDSVQVVEALTGRLLWQRDLADRFVRHVKATDRHVVVLVDNAASALVFERQTGRLVGQLALGATLANTMALFTGRCMVYYANGKLVCRRLDDGRVLWEKVEQSFRRLQQVGPNLLAVVYNNQMLELMELDSGKTRWRLQSDQVGRYVYDLALSPDGRLLYSFGRLSDNTWALVATEVATGKRTMMLNTGRYASYRLALSDVARCGPVFPLVIREGPSSTYQIRFHRRADGRVLDQVSLPTDQGDGRLVNLRSMPRIIGSAIVIHSDDRLTVYASRSDRSEGATP